MGILLLLTTALIWGCAFLFQKMGGDCVGPFAFTVYRNVLAGGALLVLLLWRKRLHFNKRVLWGGFCCGFALWFPSMLQQIGIQDISPGTCAFLTANYSLCVPLLGLFLGKKIRWFVWIGVLLALSGTFLICLKNSGEFNLGRGEFLTLLCAVFYAVQILVVDYFVMREDVLILTCLQFLFGAVLGLPFLMLPSEIIHLNWHDIHTAMVAILYCGFISSGIAYTLQNVGQKLVSPAIAGIILSLESVFGVFFGWLAWRCNWSNVLEEMTSRRLTGYALVFFAIILVQICDVYCKNNNKNIE